ncbi:MAG: insulinase family protein [Spirochaetaceae bacterium]|jgi:Zn-dependent M16 (insulinase) family peptidase|nr:insulinase family protein [Spirochaetaceae bacterium]
MKTELQAGTVLDSGFEVLEVVDLAELNAAGVLARRRDWGMEVFHIFNDDPENLFAFGFATAPEDSTGAPHILEHLVLCGSERYPLRDAFLILAQGSLQTFLNAMTFPDKTLYPASSVNEHDYFNLMAVYGDAVFRPLLSEWSFMQEGHRLEFAPADSSPESRTGGGLRITGVVYNEMKGAYSAPDTYANLWSVRSVMPDTPYALESGGDPEHIPDLSWETLKQFHRTRYSPANCRVFLAGNIPTEKQLAFLNERFFAGLSRDAALSAASAASPVPKAARWTAPRSLRIPCPAGADEKATVSLSWLCSDITDGDETIALSALSEILLGHDGSPLTRLLIESGLGEDLAPCSGLETDLRETVFCAGLMGAETGSKTSETIAALILGELERLVREGIPKEEIEAALLSMEFSNREIRRAGAPYSLVWLQRAFRGWLHGAKPWTSLLFVPRFTRLKERLAADSRFFESLIQKYLLDNPHRALVTVAPRKGYWEAKEAALTAKLAEKEAALSGDERQSIREKSAELERIQSRRDSPAALAAIPHLSRRDLSPDVERIPRELRAAAGSPALIHDLFTNGITYADIAFPVDILNADDYLWLPLFTGAVVSVGLPGMGYAEVSSLIARTAGDIHASLRNGSLVEGASRTIPTPAGVLDLAGRDWLVYRVKALDEKAASALDLTRRLIIEADFSDSRRIRDLVLEMKNDMSLALAPSGHTFAAGRSSRGFSRSRTISELWSGLDQLRFVHTLADLDTAEICGKLTALRDRLRAGGFIASLTCQAETLEKTLACLETQWRDFGPPRPRNPATQKRNSFASLQSGPVAAEVYASPSLQVGFAALALPGAAFPRREHAAEAVLSHQLSTGALWEDIRMKGGAYGAFAYADGGERIFGFSTYRDPAPLRSLDAFTAILRDRSGRPLSAGDAAAIEDAASKEDAASREDALEKAIIGRYAKETPPRTAAEKGSIDFSRFLYGVDACHREMKLRALIDITEEEVAEAAWRLAESASSAAHSLTPVIIAGSGAAKEAAGRMGVELRELPV